MRYFYDCQRGRSMIELLGVLAVIGVLSIGGIAAYSAAMNKFNITNLIENINTTTRTIKNLYSTQKSYEDLDTQVISLNLVAGARKGAQNKLISSVDGEIIIKPIARNRGFVMVYNGLDQKTCNTLASTDWGNSSTGLRYLVVSPTGIMPPRGYPSNLDTGEYEVKDLPLSPAKAAANCVCNPILKCGIAWFYE